jgi:hypothetical protein
MEIAMSKIALQVPTSLSACLQQIFVGGPSICSSDLQSFSDKALEDIGLTRRRANIEAAKPFWLAEVCSALSSSGIH